MTSIESFAFMQCPLLELSVVKGSYAHQYAIDNGLSYRLRADWLN